MTEPLVLVDIDDVGVATVTLNRPDRLNAWSDGMSVALSTALQSLDENTAVAVIVITGAGRAFCAGVDLSADGTTFQRKPGEDPSALLTLPWSLHKPVVAAINGHAIGVGITYPLLCDIRFVSEEAKVGFSFVRRGLISELGSHVVLPRIVGSAVAADLLLSGRTISGREAAQLGLANAALPADDVLSRARAWARDVAVNAAPISVAATKRLLWEGMIPELEELRLRERSIVNWLGNQPDAREGVLSFLEKRRPVWTMALPGDLPPM